ncbi:MAG: porin [Comamonadaceae bacterium]|nr:MAG: porin [Comamonadaceae bacterium]
MKKSLVALAVLAASGASFAQSTVTVYGIADIFWAQTSGTGAVTQNVLNSGGVSGSRWGLKGSEDLGGGLKANFVLENGFNIDTGAAAGALFNRQAYVGFSGGFGEVKLGNAYTAYDDISGAANAAFDSALAPVSGVWTSTGYNSNPTNNIVYATPSMSGFSGAVSYALGENKTAAVSASYVSSFHVKYEGGPVYVGLGYQKQQPVGATASTSFTRLNGTYDLGVAKLLAGYGRVSAPAGAETTEWELGADVPVSAAMTLSGGFARSSDNVAAGNATRNGYGLAVAYGLSKRTTLYGGLQSATKSLAGVDTTARVVAAGVKHTF